MMASSQVEIAPPSTFSCRRDPCFRNNLVTSNSTHIEFQDLWVHQPQWQSTINTDADADANATDNNGYSGVKIEEPKRKDKWARAREIVFSVDSQKQSERTVEASNSRGVSSLVKKWKGFEAEAKFNSRSNTATTTSTIIQDNNGGMEPPRGHVNSEDLDALGDWESDKTGFSAPTSCRDSDATESERVRVVDIIRKLTEVNDVCCESPPRIRTSMDQSEQRCYTPVMSSPRIRGRQAYNDLLTQMEHDREKELQGLVGRKAVSKFSHRGRIQALLRFRFLRRGMEEARDGRPPYSTSSQSHKPPIAHFRGRVHPSTQIGFQSGSCRKELIDNTPAATSSCAASQQRKENQHNEHTNSESCFQDSQTSKELDEVHKSHKVDKNIQQKDHLLHSCEQIHVETSPSSTVMSLETARALHDTEINSAVTTESFDNIENNVHMKEEDATNHQATKTDCDLTSDCADPQSYHEGECIGDKQIVETCMYWVSDVSHPEVGWQELQSDYEQQEGCNLHWIDEVSRPLSDWEDLRQARYQEMLDHFSNNEEIRTLLGRSCVSAFLSSDLRDKIDRLMISRSGGKQTLKVNQIQEQSIVYGKGEGEDAEDEQDGEGEEYGDYFDEYEEAENSSGQQYNEAEPGDSPPASWPQRRQSHELSDYSYQIATPSPQQSSSNYYSQDNGPSSSFRSYPAIEMEVIYDLRGHMEQLLQEMSELRKSIKCCMDMQTQLQCSIKKEVAIALNHSDAKSGRRNSAKKVTSGGRCCVCSKMKVDCLLYRCGHMCTCFKCAHELQWGSGKCPICRAPIVDVVRTYSNYASHTHQ